MNEVIGSCIYNMIQNLYRRLDRPESVALNVKIWPRYTGGTMTIYEITRNCRFHKKKSVADGTDGRLTRMPIFTGFTVIITLSKRSDESNFCQ